MPTLTKAEVCQLARDHGNGVPPALILAIAEAESGLRTDVPSSDGLGTGLMQITIHFHPDVNLNNPVVAIDVGSRIMVQNFYYLNHMRGNIVAGAPAREYPWENEEYTRRAVSAYNAGAGNVAAWDARGLIYGMFMNAGYSHAIWNEYQANPCG